MVDPTSAELTDAEEAEENVEDGEAEEVEGGGAASFARKRRELRDFFAKRWQSGQWSTATTHPGRGADAEYDALILSLGLTENRPYASRQWRIFKADKGSGDQPVISRDVRSNVVYHQKAIRQYQVDNRICLVANALEKFEKSLQTDSDPEDEELCQFLLTQFKSQKLQSVFFETIDQLTKKYAACVSGARLSTISSKANLFEHWSTQIHVGEFMDIVSTTVFDGSKFERSYVSNIFVDDIHRLLRKEWSLAMTWLESTMVLQLEGARETIY